VLLQILIRKEALAQEDSADLLALLPNDEIWNDTLRRTANEKGCSVEDLGSWANILEATNDDEKCERFMQQQRPAPLFVLSYILRHSSNIRDVDILGRIIDLFHTNCRDGNDKVSSPESAGEGGSKLTTQNIKANEYSIFISMLAHHCVRLEPRLLVNLAAAVSSYIENFPDKGQAASAFQERCTLFNDSLVLFRPQSRLHVAQTALPNAYFWEAQRILLSMSDGLKKPLLVDGRGFRAIRDVLAGMPKSGAEVHNSLRHAPTWPPYLRPGDGIDETSDPEDNWGRTVGAGMLMQEAGYSKYEWDEALDILQGMAPDGSPTIQQRIALGDWRRAGKWEASIRATRNAQEAWNRFLAPPIPEAVPSVDAYAAMFEKLVLREAKPNSGLLPGDKAINFPVHRQANLADIEWARQLPPSVSQLYDRMRLNGLHPTGHCLHILVSNAESVDLANRYLTDAAAKHEAYRSLISDSDPDALKAVDAGLVCAYVNVLLRADGKRAWKHFRRAMRIASSKLEGTHSRWVPLIWGPILKGLSQHYNGLRISLAEQLTLISQIAERIETGYGLTLSTFNQLNKCLRKIVGRELRPALEEMRSESQESLQPGSLLTLYNRDTAAKSSSGESSPHQDSDARDGHFSTSPAGLSKWLAGRLKQNFQKLQSREASLRRRLRFNTVSPLDSMASRSDPVQNEHALEYMTALAFVGEFEEMRRVLHWLINEWGKPEVIEAIEALGEPPSYAEFFEVLCVFRLFAEPMLDAKKVTALQNSISSSGLTWAWPNDEAIEGYLIRSNKSLMTLRQVVQWVQHRM
jgi:hypothetical protein